MLSRGLLSMGAVLALGACVLDFEAYDPRLATGEGGGHVGGHGGGTSQGGATSTSTGGGGGGGETGGAGGGEPLRCGTPALLADDFDDAEPSSMWWTYADAGSSIDETGGALVVTLAEEAAAWAGYTSRHVFDLRDARFFVEIPVTPDPSTAAVGAITVGLDGNHYVQLAVRGGQIEASDTRDGTFTLRHLGDYDPVAHRYLQLRDEAGTFFWEVSADGEVFTAVASAATSGLFPLDLVRCELSGYTNGSEISPGEVHFDDVMGAIAPSVGWCAPDTLTDDFEDGVVGVAWDPYATGDASHDETGGQLVLTNGPGSGNTAYTSAKLFDLTDGAATVEVPAVAALATSYTFFRLEIDGDNGVELLVSGGEIRAVSEVGGTSQTVFETAHDATEHRWWRIRESGGIVYWDTSPDGSRWSELGQQRAPLDVTALEVFLGSGLGTAGTESDATLFDNYNLR